MNERPSAWPLQWPVGKERTSFMRRERSRFKTGKGGYSTDAYGNSTYRGSQSLTIASARQRLEAELDRLGARLSVLSTNVELRLDGMPRSGRNAPEDPGVAVYFQLRGKPITLACDRYTTVADNIAAIAAHIDAMRTAERHGVGSLEQMFSGFTALPPAMAPMDWRTVLGNPKTLANAEAVYRELASKHHPDVGGSEARMAELNAAITEARKALT